MPGIDFSLVKNGMGVTTPSLQDLMQAVQNGFLKPEDIVKRQNERARDNSATGTQIEADDFKRRRMAEENQLAPQRNANEQANLGIEASMIPAKQAAANAQSTDIIQSSNPATHDDYVNRKLRESARQEYAQYFGEVPHALDVAAKEKVPSKQEFIKQQLTALPTELASFKSGFTPGSKEDSEARAEYMNARETQILKNADVEYEKASADAKGRTKQVVKGTPEYDNALFDKLTEHKKALAMQGAVLKAAPNIWEAQAKAAAEGPEKSRALAQSNRKDYSALDEVQALRKVDAAYHKIENAVTSESSPFNDMSAIFSFMKVLDPGSTVREGEYATAENARSVPETVKNFYNKVLTGTKLTPEQRKDLLGAAKGNLDGQVKNAAPRIKQYLDIEKQLGVSPGEIVPPEDAALIGGSTSAKPVATSYEALVGKRVTLNNGKSGVVKKAADGTYTLE